MKKNIRLSVAIATFNEEKNIRRCLKSVKDIADEIVIVDGESTDQTVEITKEFHAKIIVRENPAIFHINKQKAINECTGLWILQLDADEEVSLELKEEIKKVISAINGENGYWIPRKNYFLGRFLMKGGQYPDYTMRLYKNGKGRLPQKDVHEQAIITGDVGYLRHPLLHYPYDTFDAYHSKWMRYNYLLASQLESELKNSTVFNKIYVAFMYLIVKPSYWMFISYVRHKGFMDSWQGLVFSFFSSLRFPVAYLLYLQK